MRATLDVREQLEKRQLERWLVGRRGARNSRRFVLAVLRDTFADEGEIDRWLSTPRPELGGATAAELLDGERAPEVEALAVRAWNGR